MKAATTLKQSKRFPPDFRFDDGTNKDIPSNNGPSYISAGERVVDKTLHLADVARTEVYNLTSGKRLASATTAKIIVKGKLIGSKPFDTSFDQATVHPFPKATGLLHRLFLMQLEVGIAFPHCNKGIWQPDAAEISKLRNCIKNIHGLSYVPPNH